MATANPNPEAKVETPAESAAPKAPTSIKIGDRVRLRAVHGFIQNPFTLDNFDVDASKKVVVDSWAVIQFEAGKLAIDTDE